MVVVLAGAMMVVVVLVVVAAVRLPRLVGGVDVLVVQGRAAVVLDQAAPSLLADRAAGHAVIQRPCQPASNGRSVEVKPT